jgi:hypothetical protein
MLFLFSHLVTILDDSEFYESGEPFAQHEYTLLGILYMMFLFSHLVTILDDSEFYESGEPFAQHEYALLASYLCCFF